VRLAALQSLICIEVPDAFGSPDPASASPFPTDSCGLPSTPAPALVKVRVHPLRSFASSSEIYSVFIGSLSEDTEHTNTGFFPLRDTSTRSPLTTKVQRFVYRSTRSVSHALDGLLLLVRRGFVSPHNRVQDSHFRGFPCYLAVSDFRRLVPSCRSTSPSPRSKLPVPTR
jgi:hypothetical protein